MEGLLSGETKLSCFFSTRIFGQVKERASFHSEAEDASRTCSSVTSNPLSVISSAATVGQGLLKVHLSPVPETCWKPALREYMALSLLKARSKQPVRDACQSAHFLSRYLEPNCNCYSHTCIHTNRQPRITHMQSSKPALSAFRSVEAPRYFWLTDDQASKAASMKFHGWACIVIGSHRLEMRYQVSNSDVHGAPDLQ